MAIWDLFSKRAARARKQGQEDVFQYENLPQQFRAQVIHIWNDSLGHFRDDRRSFGPTIPSPSNDLWIGIFRVLTREKGTFRLGEGGSNPQEQCYEFIMNAPTEEALDIIEVSFGMVDTVVRGMEQYVRQRYGLCDPDDAIKELNGRFREHAIGYEFAGGEIVRVDSQFLHAEAVKPALQLLHGAGKKFAGPLQEFLAAHARYRKGDFKEATADALKAFESTLKAICVARGWTYDPHKDTASKLLQIVFDNGLVPAWLQSQFTALKSVLEAGVPTVRNKTSGHGQGPVPAALPAHFAAFVLHLTASNIVFLIDCHREMR
jgi:hypothetical protein